MNGYFNTALDLNTAIAIFWDWVRELKACLWIDRIPTDCELEQGCHRYGWEMVQPNIPAEWSTLCDELQGTHRRSTKRHLDPGAKKSCGLQPMVQRTKKPRWTNNCDLGWCDYSYTGTN